ncbi:MAG: PIG-L deacetylase family protein [Actinomycetota bacterium]
MDRRRGGRRRDLSRLGTGRPNLSQSGSRSARIAAVADLGTILCAFAHPDDETYLAGGLMAEAARAGRRSVCVVATRGEAGHRADFRPRRDDGAQ